jgi:hypothetical protein
MASQPRHVVNQDYGLVGLCSEALSEPFEYGILIPYALIRKQATFTVLEDTAFDIETPAVKRRKYNELGGKIPRR